MRPRNSAVSFVRHGSRGQTLVPLFYILKKQNRVAPCPQRVPCLKINNRQQSAGDKIRVQQKRRHTVTSLRHALSGTRKGAPTAIISPLRLPQEGSEGVCLDVCCYRPRYRYSYSHRSRHRYRYSPRSLIPNPSEKSINKTYICKNKTNIYINKTIICTNITFIYSFQRGEDK